MYGSFYGVRERPFELTPNPRFLFMTAHHREALSNLEYGLSGRTGIALLIGMFSVVWMLWTGPAQATTIEWANAGSTWAIGSNWVGGTAPADSTVTDIASFGSTGVSPINPNLTVQRSINGLIFLSGAYSYTIGGSIITIGGSGISNSATNIETFSDGIRTSTSQTWTTNSGGTLVLNGTVDINQNLATTRTLTVNGAGNTTFNGTIKNSFVGSTGNASPDAPHLHFAIFALGPERRWWQGAPLDPLPFLAD